MCSTCMEGTRFCLAHSHIEQPCSTNFISKFQQCASGVEFENQVVGSKSQLFVNLAFQALC